MAAFVGCGGTRQIALEMRIDRAGKVAVGICEPAGLGLSQAEAAVDDDDTGLPQPGIQRRGGDQWRVRCAQSWLRMLSAELMPN